MIALITYGNNFVVSNGRKKQFENDVENLRTLTPFGHSVSCTNFIQLTPKL